MWRTAPFFSFFLFIVFYRYNNVSIFLFRPHFEKRTKFSSNLLNLSLDFLFRFRNERIGWFETRWKSFPLTFFNFEIDFERSIHRSFFLDRSEMWTMKGKIKREERKERGRLSNSDFFFFLFFLNWKLPLTFERLDFLGRIVFKQWRINDRLIGAVPSVFKVAMLIVLSCSQPWILFSTSTSNKFLSNLYQDIKKLSLILK